MKEQKLTIYTAVFLTIVGIALIFLRVQFRLKSELEPGESIWRLTYKVSVDDAKMGTRITANLPQNTNQIRISQERFFRSGLIMDIISNRQTRNREAIAIVLKGTTKILFTAEFDIHINSEKTPLQGKKKISANTRSFYLRKENDFPLSHPEIKRLQKAWHKNNKQIELIEKIFAYCSENINKQDGGAQEVVKVLARKSGDALGIARTMVTMCRASKIPARLVTGFIIEANQNAQPHSWVQILDKKTWFSFDPYYGYHNEIPINYLPVSISSTEIIDTVGSQHWQHKFVVQRIRDFSDSSKVSRSHLISLVDLTHMHPGMQEALTILLLLPVGALIIIIFRNFVGLKTFGTFSPCLFAVSFIYADWRTGFITLLLVFILGVFLRKFLESLKLLIIARLSIILTIVVMCMIITISILDYLQLTPSSRAVVLPIIIITMLIEHFQITAEEDGYNYSFKLLLGTFVVAFCCHLVMCWRELGRLVLTYPESLLIIVAIILLTGRYAGYRLTELVRFRDFINED